VRETHPTLLQIPPWLHYLETLPHGSQKGASVKN
jgi:hypothetical protein